MMYSKAEQTKKDKPEKKKTFGKPKPKSGIKRRQRKCKECKKWFKPERDCQSTCSTQCAIDYAPTLKQKQHRKALKAHNNSDKSVLIRKAQKTFNKYIRVRDYGNPCISCGHTGNRQRHASHYRPVGRNSKHRFSEVNVHSACSICNQHLSGNLVPYREALVKMYGESKISELESDNEPYTWTIEELKSIIIKYKKATDEMQSRRVQ